jgi:hypothetical protein
MHAARVSVVEEEPGAAAGWRAALNCLRMHACVRAGRPARPAVHPVSKPAELWMREGCLGPRSIQPSHLADEAVAVLGEGDDRGGGAAALGVCDDGGLAALHGRHGAVGGAQVHADDLWEGGRGEMGACECVCACGVGGGVCGARSSRARRVASETGPQRDQSKPAGRKRMLRVLLGSLPCR